MEIFVSGIGIASAIGIGVERCLQSLRSSQDGLCRAHYLKTAHPMPVAEVKATNEELKALLGIDLRQSYSRTALLGMVAVGEAMRDAQLDPTTLRVGLVSATSVGGMDLTENFYREFRLDDRRGRLRDVVSHDCADSTNRIAAYHHITGFSTTISTACSSAANAIMLGARLIRHNRLDAVVVGGTDALCRFTLNGFGSLIILDSGRCRPFDASRNGLNLGEGAGFLVLQRAETLRRTPYCTLAGYANANDAFHQTASSAEGDGAYLAMSGALASAGMTPDQIDYLNVHGTGTKNNDQSEGAAMLRIWGDRMPPFSSTKPFTGHTLAAAGGIEAVLSVLSIDRGMIYPNLNFETPIEELKLQPQTELQTEVPIRAVMSNSFGFGGNNSSLIFRKSR